MSNPTSNFGWQMPTNTDLVSQLPADFEVFGQAVDTSLMDLKGGTTGQILSKASGTDMDFTWVAPTTGDITGVSVTSPITGGGTSGDVTIGISSSAVVPSQTGNSGKYLTTDGTTSSWGTISAGGMTLLSTTTMSGTTTTISGISADYVDLVAYVVNDRPNAAAGFYMYINGTNGSYSQWGNQQGSNFGGTSEGNMINGFSATSATANNNFSRIHFPYYAGSGNRKMAIMNRSFLVNAGNRENIMMMGHYYGGTAAVSSITFEYIGSTFAGGTVYLYGVK